MSEGDVVVDRLRERVRLLEDHPDQLSDLHRIDLRSVEVLAVVEQPPGDLGDRHEVVHPVQAADQRALAASRGPDQRRDLVPVDVESDVLDGGHAAVGDRDALQLEDLLERADVAGFAKPGRP